MAKESSVAPKERVNIVYRPATGGAQEEVELPLKMLVMGDFTNAPDDRMLEDREPINVDKDNFDEVLKAQDIKVDVTVPNKLSESEIHFFVEEADVPPHLKVSLIDSTYGEKYPLFRRSSGEATVTVFQGGHELIPAAAMNWLEKQRKISGRHIPLQNN